MNKQKIILLVAITILIGATAVACAFMKSNRRLGNPGLRLTQKPSLGVDGKAVRDQSIELPENVLDFKSKEGVITPKELETLPPDTLFGRKIYEAPDRFSAFISVVLMGVDSRSIHKPEICLPSQGWKMEINRPKVIPMEKPIAYNLPIREVIASKTIQGRDGSTQLVKTVFLYWFVEEDEMTADHLDRMWRMGAEMLRTGRLQRWAYVACMSHCYAGQEDATYERLKKFIVAAVPEFQLPPGQGKPTQTAAIEPQTQTK